VTGAAIQRAYLALATAGMAREGIRNVHKPIAAALALQVRLGTIRTNPADGCELPGAATPERPVWTPAQVGRFLAATADDPRFGALYRLAFCLGLRRGELLALRRSDLDLGRAVLSVRRTLSEDEFGRDAIREQAKTATSRRDLALPPVCVAALRRHLAAQPVAGALLFHRGDGRVHNPNTLGDHFVRTAAALGLPHMRFHDARHCAATALKALGIHPWIVADILGHGSTAMSRSYAHGTPAAQVAALSALEAAYQHDNTMDANGTVAPISAPIPVRRPRKTAT